MSKQNVMILLVGLAVLIGCKSEDNAKPLVIKPALNVSVIEPQTREIAQVLSANGLVLAWQEAIISAEVEQLKLLELNVDIGDTVKKGQVLAVFADDSVLIDIAQSKAALLEAQAQFAEAQLNRQRAAKIGTSGALSAQQIDQYATQANIAQAKIAAVQAQLDAHLLRQKKTHVLATDDGVISARTATLGMVAAQGQELFRLIRGQRLEWRGEVTASELNKLKINMPVSVTVPDVTTVQGTVRTLAPSLDAQTRNALVYVDLPNAAKQGLRSGMFAQGDFVLGAKKGLTIPQDAVTLRDGFRYVFRLAAQNKVVQVKVQTGRRVADWVEITEGITEHDKLIASGGAFLNDGDSVNVVQSR